MKSIVRLLNSPVKIYGKVLMLSPIETLAAQIVIAAASFLLGWLLV